MSCRRPQASSPPRSSYRSSPSRRSGEGDIHARPDEARELLSDFAEFTRYLFRDGRSYVTLGEEIDHVERYLRLEQARFRDSLHVTVEVPAVVGVPVISPDVELMDSPAGSPLAV